MALPDYFWAADPPTPSQKQSSYLYEIVGDYPHWVRLKMGSCKHISFWTNGGQPRYIKKKIYTGEVVTCYLVAAYDTLTHEATVGFVALDKGTNKVLQEFHSRYPLDENDVVLCKHNKADYRLFVDQCTSPRLLNDPRVRNIQDALAELERKAIDDGQF